MKPVALNDNDDEYSLAICHAFFAQQKPIPSSRRAGQVLPLADCCDAPGAFNPVAPGTYSASHPAVPGSQTPDRRVCEESRSLITVGRDEPRRPLFAAIPARRAVKRGRVDRAKLIPWADWKSGLGDGGQGALWRAAHYNLSVSQFLACGLLLGGGDHTANYLTKLFKLLGWGTARHVDEHDTGDQQDVVRQGQGLGDE